MHAERMAAVTAHLASWLLVASQTSKTTVSRDTSCRSSFPFLETCHCIAFARTDALHDG